MITDDNESETVTEEDIVEDFLEKEAMYMLAEENGYTAADVDYEAYKTAITEAYENSENKDETQSFFAEF